MNGDVEQDDDHLKDYLTYLLNECLSTEGQEHSFKVLGILDGKFVVAFDIVQIPEDDYIGFSGY